MTICYRSPRRANRSSNVELVMRLWDTPEQQAKIARGVVIEQVRSPYGNINEQGTPYPSQTLEAIDRLRPPWARSADSAVDDRGLPPNGTAGDGRCGLIDKAEMILALAAIGREGLAGEAAVDLYRAARQRRLCSA